MTNQKSLDKKCPHLSCLVYHPDGICNCDMARYCSECKEENIESLDKKKECGVMEHDFKHLKRFGRADVRCPICNQNVILLLVYAQEAGIDLTK